MENIGQQMIDLKVNGKKFPLWILKNFKEFKLPAVIHKGETDPCSVKIKMELRKYQLFMGKYLHPKSPFRDILLYHGLGSGKTGNCINILNVVYNYDPTTDFVFLIKASLHDDPWLQELNIWLQRADNESNISDPTKLSSYKHIHFVHYDSPFADKAFLELMKKLDPNRPKMFIIDEAHNFIRNVYSNINSKSGKRAQVIYDYIQKEKKDNTATRIILISATPGINVPFEFALMFNLLRPGIFPSSETEFNRLFLSESIYPILNPSKKNLFQRRIMGLVSYYIGATPDLFATSELKYVNLPMSDYQYEIYRVFEKTEAEIQRKAARYGKTSQLYRTYTRQACNFVFPYVNQHVTGAQRPRPGKFMVSNKVAEDLTKGKEVKVATTEDNDYMNKYLAAIDKYLNETNKYFEQIANEDIKNGHSLKDDLEEFKKNYSTMYKGKFKKYFFKTKSQKSKTLEEMYKCSPKMTAIVFYSYISPGKVMVYTNYVLMEGIDILKIYLRLAGFNDYKVAKENMGFCEYHGRIDPKDRKAIKKMYNESNNIRGNKCKIFILSPSATEGIQLYGIRQEHILEPYWTEVRIFQVVGRGIRQCSHKELPLNERNVTVFRYKVQKPKTLDETDKVKHTTDEYIEDEAKAKDNLIQSFLTALKEVAVDCELFKEHNQMSQSYQCFKFPNEIMMAKTPGPAYREDIKEDVKYDSGLGAKNTRVERIRVVKIMAVYQIGNDANGDTIFSPPENFWYDSKKGTIYDFDLYYPVGSVEMVNGLPAKLNKDTYIMTDLVDIPTFSI